MTGFIEVHGTRQRSLRVRCRWCCSRHSHGHVRTPVGETTARVAQCRAPDSLYKTGYNILVSGTRFSAVRQTVRLPTAAQMRAIHEGRIGKAVQKLRDQAPPAG